MADAYGNFSVETSNNCVVDSAAFVKALNEFSWSNDGGNWATRKNDRKDSFWYEGGFSRPQYPTVRPLETSVVIVAQEDGELKRIPADDATEDDWENMYDSESAPIALKVLSEQLSAHIGKGWVEISCSANEKASYSYFETLRVFADGKAESKQRVSGALVAPEDKHEVYEPTH